MNNESTPKNPLKKAHAHTQYRLIFSVIYLILNNDICFVVVKKVVN